MAAPTQQPVRTPIPLEVVRTSRPAPHMVRVVFGGPGLGLYQHNAFTDRYVKLVFPRPGVEHPTPLDLPALRASLPPDQWPRLRTYTVRSYDGDAGELTIDFVHHGDEGIAGPWAAQAQPGDQLHALGPGGAYAPDPSADWHLFVGDEAAFPAIAAALEAVPDQADIVAVFEIGDDGDRAYLRLPERAQVTWLLREGEASGLLDAVRALTFPPGSVHAFVHAELGVIRDLRRHLLDDRQVPLERLSLSGYWRRGKDEEGFQAEKAEEAAAASAG